MAKILIVDDSMVIRKMVSRSLEAYEITLAVNGAEGLNLFQGEAFDIVITDINMPVMDGLEMVEQIRLSEQGPKKCPVVVLSTEFSDTIKAKGKALGVNAWMVKPTHDEKLKMVVAKLLG